MTNEYEMMRNEAIEMYRSEGFDEDTIAEFIRQDEQSWKVAVKSVA